MDFLSPVHADFRSPRGLRCLPRADLSGKAARSRHPIAQSLGVPLKIAAKIDRIDESYFREQIEPMLQQPGVEFIGEINERGKTKFLGEALALLFPVDWPEPFGIVMIEAMACGTPVLAFRRGSVPEIVENGVTGQIVDTEEEAIRKLSFSLDRRAVRRFEERFPPRAWRDYLQIYRSLMRRPLPITDADPGIAVVPPPMEASLN